MIAPKQNPALLSKARFSFVLILKNRKKKMARKPKTHSKKVQLWHPAFASIELIDRSTETNTIDTPKEQIHLTAPFPLALDDQFCYLGDEDRKKDQDTLNSFFVEGVDFILSSNTYFLNRDCLNEFKKLRVRLKNI